MKKWILAIVFIILLALIFSFVFIPNVITISIEIPAHCTKNEFISCLKDSIKRKQMLYDKNGYDFKLSKQYSNGADIIIENNGKKYFSHLMSITVNTDSSLITWQATLNTGRNPIKRIARYINSIMLKRSMEFAGENMSHFLNNTNNIYGFPIIRTNFNNAILLAIRKNTKADPSSDTLYKLVGDLKAYIQNAGAKETDYPMFHFVKKDSMLYDIMVAIPIDRIIPENNSYFIIRMIHMEGKFIKTEVKGGPSAIKSAHLQIQKFMVDHQITSPAIPFEIMVTDRNKIKDTTQWITKIYYPST